MPHHFMSMAMTLAKRGEYSARPNPMVGCVVVKQGKVVGKGFHQRAGGPHAEVIALEQAGKDAKGATLYVTLEPCHHFGRTPPCTAKIISSGISEVYIAMQDPNPLVSGQGIQALMDKNIRVHKGILEEKARQLNKGFISRMSRHRPWVRCKMAMSMDGCTALSDKTSQWITGAQSRIDVHRLRARSGAILTGVGTVIADNPAMTVRLGSDVKYEPPLRVILDSQLRTPLQAKILTEFGRTLIATCQSEITNEWQHLEIIRSRSVNGRIDLLWLLQYLAKEVLINDVLLETGATLAGAMLKAGLIDELVFYMAPHLMGSGNFGLFDFKIQSMQQRLNLDITDLRMVGQDIRITALPRKICLQE